MGKGEIRSNASPAAAYQRATRATAESAPSSARHQSATAIASATARFFGCASASRALSAASARRTSSSGCAESSGGRAAPPPAAAAAYSAATHGPGRDGQCGGRGSSCSRSLPPHGATSAWGGLSLLSATLTCVAGAAVALCGLAPTKSAGENSTHDAAAALQWAPSRVHAWKPAPAPASASAASGWRGGGSRSALRGHASAVRGQCRDARAGP